MVNWVSKAPYTVNGNPQSTAGNANASPAYCTGIGQTMGLCNGTTNGRSPIMVTAIGEESFIDANGNGVFDPADTVAFNASNPDNNYTSGANSGKPKPWQDTSEPFMNEWELYDAYGTPTYVAGEPFIDFNNNGTARRTGWSLQRAAVRRAALQYRHVGRDWREQHHPVRQQRQSARAGAQRRSAILTALPDALVEIFDDRLKQMPAGTTVSRAVERSQRVDHQPGRPAAWPCSTAGPYVTRPQV